MTAWRLRRWVWELRSPLHIGLHPSGALSRCRLHVPPRVLWGALTAEKTRAQWDRSANDCGKQYRDCGDKLNEKLRFTCLFPAERVKNQYRVWLPEYDPRSGLVYQWKDEKTNETHRLGERAFRKRLLLSRAGTAVAPESDAAREGSLHETECIAPFWRDTASPVYLAGYVLEKNDENDPESPLENMPNELHIGGDTRYGLGRIHLITIKEDSPITMGEAEVGLEGENPEVHGNTLLGYGKYEPGTGVQLCGAVERYSGWDGGCRSEASLSWVPGSRTAAQEKTVWEIEPGGNWKQKARQEDTKE